jgi:hypothetical protein
MRVREWFRTVAASRKRNPVHALSRHLLRDIGWLDINDEYLHRSHENKPRIWDE